MGYNSKEELGRRCDDGKSRYGVECDGLQWRVGGDWKNRKQNRKRRDPTTESALGKRVLEAQFIMATPLKGSRAQNGGRKDGPADVLINQAWVVNVRLVSPLQ